MQIGERVTWKEHVRPSRTGKWVRFTTGVIIGERPTRAGRQLQIAVEFMSGKLPAKPRLVIWVSELTVLFGRTSASQHVSKVSPQTILKRANQSAIRAALIVKEREIERLRLALNRAGIWI